MQIYVNLIRSSSGTRICRHFTDPGSPLNGDIMQPREKRRPTKPLDW